MYIFFILVVPNNVMKKILFLFSTLFLISCSSDDDDSNQNFLEKYNGVYWASNDNDDFWLQFNLANFVQCDNDDNESCYCDLVSWGGSFENVATVSIKQNEVEKLIINFSAQIEDITLSYDLNIKAINDGNGIEVLYPAGFEDVNESTETFTRYNSQPCN